MSNIFFHIVSLEVGVLLSSFNETDNLLTAKQQLNKLSISKFTVTVSFFLLLVKYLLLKREMVLDIMFLWHSDKRSINLLMNTWFSVALWYPFQDFIHYRKEVLQETQYRNYLADRNLMTWNLHYVLWWGKHERFDYFKSYCGC